jgi:hypothetical protein
MKPTSILKLAGYKPKDKPGKTPQKKLKRAAKSCQRGSLLMASQVFKRSAEFAQSPMAQAFLSSKASPMAVAKQRIQDHLTHNAPVEQKGPKGFDLS